MEMSRPASVMPRFGTNSSSIRQSRANENVRVPRRTARVTFSRGSRYHRRMIRAENVPIAICTTRTVTVTTKPVSAAVAPTIAARTALAVDGEYSHKDGAEVCSSAQDARAPRNPPTTAPIAGIAQRPRPRSPPVGNAFPSSPAAPLAVEATRSSSPIAPSPASVRCDHSGSMSPGTHVRRTRARAGRRGGGWRTTSSRRPSGSSCPVRRRVRRARR